MKYVSYSAMAGLALALAWVGWRQYELAGELARIRAARPGVVNGSHLSETSAAAIQELRNRFERTRIDLSAALHGISQTSAKVDTLQKAVDTMGRQMQTTLAALETNKNVKPGPATSPPPEQKLIATLEKPAAPQKPKPPKNLVRHPWSPEQATGAPDTLQAGDNPTAWAPLSPNSGIQWLELEYAQTVEVAEIKVRQTFNPGAVCKITALNSSGQETKLWEGKQTPAEAPAEIIFPVNCRVHADRIKVYLDTQRVAGWNEIDAVELVGRDGTRQWAIDAKASSSYADRKRS